MFYVTTSWDDGSAYDLKLAALLATYGAKGTFYIARELPPKYQDIKLLTGQEVLMLAQKQEIGAHTLTHPDLVSISGEQALHEMKGSKEWLENLLSRDVTMFCYPFGLYNANVAALAHKAGFMGARTTKSGHIEMPLNSYEMHTTIKLSPFPFRKVNANRYYWRYLLSPWLNLQSSYRKIGVPLWSTSWLSAATSAFDYAYKHGEVFHLWGHSWEVERYGMWDDLEKLLHHIAAHKDIRFVTNGELLEATGKKV